MPIPVQNNIQYGGILVNQKYAPLEINAVQIDNNSVQAEYVQLFQGRIDRLQKENLLPGNLNLYAKNWNTIRANEAARQALPPIVVVSSNRSKWISTIYNRANELQRNNFNGVNDIRALVAGATPWYHPKRINNPNRHVYIVVHQVEYYKYQRQLLKTNLTVIGWEFEPIKSSNPQENFASYVGFGASRFAAIEFCKYVFNVLCNPPLNGNRQKAWLVDDNVVYVRGFPGFALAEGAMNGGVWGLGFTGATRNIEDQKITQLAAGTSAQMNNLLDVGLLQQCVLWNIDQLRLHYLNFSPYFATSNEDTSFSNYLQNHENSSKLRLASGATVIKAMPDQNDETQGTRRLAFLLRNKAVNNFAQREQYYKVRLINNPQQNLILIYYIQNYVLPNALPEIREEDKKFTQSKAVEQIMAKVVKEKKGWVPKRIFKPNGDMHQVIQQITT